MPTLQSTACKLFYIQGFLLTCCLATPQRASVTPSSPCSTVSVRKWGREKRREPRPISSTPTPIQAGLLPTPRPPCSERCTQGHGNNADQKIII